MCPGIVLLIFKRFFKTQLGLESKNEETETVSPPNINLQHTQMLHHVLPSTIFFAQIVPEASLVKNKPAQLIRFTWFLSEG